MTSPWVPAAATPIATALERFWGSPILVFATVAMAVLGIASIFFLPFALARIPTDYFTKAPEHARLGSAQWFLRIAKNLLGCLLLVIGLAMLLLPGQGLLTILVAAILIDFPGKRRFELMLVRKPLVLRTVNALRARAKHAPLCLPSASPGTR